MTRNQKETIEFATRIKALGFSVYIAESGTHGFITDATEQRVLSFQFDLVGSLSGNYGPASREAGTGWGLQKCPHELNTVKDVTECLYARTWVTLPPNVRYTTVKEHLKSYGQSSRYKAFEPNGKACILYTLDGEKDAIAGPRGIGLWRVHSVDGKYSIEVNEGTALRKFEAEEKPTFYSC